MLGNIFNIWGESSFNLVNAARDDDVEGSFGKILKKAMSPEEDSKKMPRLRKISLFAHPTRQKIFCYLCEKPCSHLRQIARDLGIAAPTAEWHLRKFVEKGVLKVKVMENKHVFYPSNMIDANDINIIWNLNNERARMIYETIMDSPGITQIKICETLNLYQQIVACSTMQLEEVGLIRSQREGRSKRYFIAKHPKEMLRSSQQRRWDGMISKTIWRESHWNLLRSAARSSRILLLRCCHRL